MPVNTRHLQYEHMAPKWERVRDAVAGEDAIKARKHAYLPLPPGIDQPWGENDPAYLNYLKRTPYLEIMAPTIQGMVGLMSRKDTPIEVPNALERLKETATADGLDLDDLMSRLRHEVLTTGRYILFVDAPDDGGDPVIACYAAESVINWRADGGRLTMIVFEEMVSEPKADDPFIEVELPQWREASIEGMADENGKPTGEIRYVVRVWRESADSTAETRKFEVISEVEPTTRGEPFDRVPAVCVGSRDLLPDPDQIPLLGVVNRTLDHYRQMADYRLGLFMSTQATPYGTGIESGERPSKVGPSAFWASQNAEAEFGYVEVSGNGLSAQQQALQDTKSEIMDAAMRVLGDGRRGAEAAEALRLRFQSQTATLASVATATAAGLAQALRYIAQWVNADPEQIEVTPNLDFIHEQPDPQVLTAIMDGTDRGLMPNEVLSGYARRTNLTDMDNDEFIAMSPAAQAMPSGDDER